MSKDKIVLKGGYVRTPIDNISEFNNNVNRGCGVHKAKKGKGSYKRKDKHREYSPY